MKKLVKLVDHILYAISWRLPNWLFYYYHSVLVHSDNPKLLTRENKSYFLKFVSDNEIPLLEKFGISEPLTRARLDSGDKCVIMGRDENIETIIWGASQKKYMKLAGVIVDPGKTGAILYGGYSVKEARMKGLFNSAFMALYDDYVQNGIKNLYAGIDVLNQASLKLHLRMNFEIIGESYFIVLFGIKICHYKFWPDNMPKLKIFIKTPPENMDWI